MRYAAELHDAFRTRRPDIVGVIDAVRSLGRRADELADVPAELLAGVDVHRLNCAYLPPQFGGEPLLQHGLARCVLGEAFGYADPALTIALPGPGLALPPIAELATVEQQRAIFTRFDNDAPVWGAFAITEPKGGSDAAHPATSARHVSDGFRISGEKSFIGNGGRAAFVIVYAQTDDARGQFGVQPFVVDCDTPGLTISDSDPMLGLRAVRVAQLTFDDCWVPEDHRLGPQDARSTARAFLSAQRSWEYWRPSLSGLIIGAIERTLDDLRNVARIETGTHFRAHASTLIERATARVSSLRLLAHHAATRFDRGKPSAIESSMAKTTAAALARSTVADALALLRDAGLGGHDVGLDIARWARDFQAFELLEGTTEVHQLMIARGYSTTSRRRTMARGLDPSKTTTTEGKR